MFKRLSAVFLILTLLAVAFVPMASAQEEGKPVYYVVSHGGPQDPFWGVVMRGVADAGEVLGVDARYVGPEVYSLEELTNLLNAAIAAEPDGIAVTITNVEAVDEPLRRAIAEGIPVIAINVSDPRPEDEKIPYLFYIGAMGYDGGYAGGKYMMADHTPNRGVCAIQEVGHIDLEARCQGFIDALEGVEVDKLDIGTDPTKAVDIIRAYFEKYPETDAFLTLGPLGTIPGVQYLKEEGKVGEIMHGSFDLGTETLDAIRDGVTMFTIDQQQYLQGFMSIVWLDLYNKYMLRPAGDLKTGPGFVTADNVEVIAELIEAKYR